ncbi:8151_t:CDS:2, partial [Paraglomus occultum]
ADGYQEAEKRVMCLKKHASCVSLGLRSTRAPLLGINLVCLRVRLSLELVSSE